MHSVGIRKTIRKTRNRRSMLPADKHPITRRDLLRGAGTGIIALAMRGELKAAQLSSRAPNIVFVLADDLGYADVSCYGRPDLRTPNIDRIAAKGVRFLQGYANSAVCTATRTALITGRYQYRRRPAARTSHAAVAAEESRLSDDARREMASWFPPDLRSAQERLRPLL